MKWRIVLSILVLSVTVIKAEITQELQRYLQQRLTPQAAGAEGTCAFRLQLELRQHWHELPQALQKEAAVLLEEPTRQVAITSPDGHFVLHYDTTGYNAVPLEDISGNGIPDYIDSAAVYCDHVWEVEINQLGFQAPPDANGQPLQRYPIYFTGFGYYGLTNFDLGEDIAALPGNNYTSYIEINNNFYQHSFYTSGLQALKVTIAHEFNHAIQLGYNFHIENGYLYPDIFFMEMTSTWLEDYVYNEVNDYLQYLPRFLPTIDSKEFNRTDGNSEYANSLYLHMLEKMFGAQIVPGIWQRIKTQDVLPAINSALTKYGSSFGESYIRYAAWLYFTGSRAQAGQFFTEAADYPLITVNRNQDELKADLGALHMRHVQLFVEQNSVYQARASASNSGGYYTHLPDGERYMVPVQLNHWQSFSQQAENPLIVVQGNPTETALSGMGYSIQLSSVVTGPQPVRVGKSAAGLTFYNVPAQSKINIFTLNGRLVAQLSNREQNQQALLWNLKDRNGVQVASGVYLFEVNDHNKTTLGKFAVVR